MMKFLPSSALTTLNYSEHPPNQNQCLVDSSGRRMRKLRVSLLDHCHFRCLYCMPKDVRFLDKSEWLPSSEISSICGNLVSLGIEELRITGGEPTLRPDFETVLEGLHYLPLKKLAMTTNGERLKGFLPFLKQIGCWDLNISLDSLDPDNFCKITQSKSFSKVMDAILSASAMGFKLKINMVLMRGINDHEVLDFIRFSQAHHIEVRFLELMKIGVATHNHDWTFISAQEIIDRLEGHYHLKLTPVSLPIDSTSFNYITQEGAQIGFIASESRPFCGNCSRLRLTPQGILRACLMKTSGLNLRGVSLKEYPSILKEVLAMKPQHRLEKIVQPMYQIGG